METSKFGKARAGVFLLLIAISLYSLFMISASNTSYAAGQSLFKFSSLIGLSPSENGFDRQRSINNVSKKLITSTDQQKSFNPNIEGTVVSAFDEGEITRFLSTPRKSKYRKVVAGLTSGDQKRAGITRSNNLLSFNGANASLSTGLVSQCIESLKPDLETEELNIDEVIACIFNSDGSLADNGTNNPFENGGSGNNGEGGLGNNGQGGSGNNGEGGSGNNGEGGPVIAEVPEPSTYMLLGLGMMTLVGFSRKKAKARIS